MKSIPAKVTFLLLVIFISSFEVPVTAQVHHNQIGHELKGSHRITLGLGHTSVSEGEVEGDVNWLIMPSWSLNYDYWFSNRWAAGLQNDVIIESFKVEEHDGEIIDRHYPVSVVPVVLYKPAEFLTLLAGVGKEFGGGHSLTLTRLGTEIGFHVPGNWEVGGALVWDAKWDYYNSWGIAFTISKILH